MKPEYFVLTAVGTDRVGIVEELAEILEEKSCNIEESRMAVLGREFAVILLASGSPEAVKMLTSGADELRARIGLQAEIRPTAAPGELPAGRPYSIEAVSLDAPGIMHAVTAVLKDAGVNIEEISTDTTSAPWTGATMFHMEGTIVLPQGVHASELREKLSSLEHERDIDIRLEPLKR